MTTGEDGRDPWRDLDELTPTGHALKVRAIRAIAHTPLQVQITLPIHADEYPLPEAEGTVHVALADV